MVGNSFKDTWFSIFSWNAQNAVHQWTGSYKKKKSTQMKLYHTDVFVVIFIHPNNNFNSDFSIIQNIH
jgi:hypothetical protein